MTAETPTQPPDLPGVTVRGNARSATIGKIAEALANAQADLRAAIKADVVRQKGKTQAGKEYEITYHYADLAEVMDCCREPLAKQHIAIIQMPTRERDGVTVITVLAHKSGEWFQSELFLPCSDVKPQAIGSAITYARRYALGAMVGVVTEPDDDGQAAAKKPRQQQDEPKSRLQKAAEQARPPAPPADTKGKAAEPAPAEPVAAPQPPQPQRGNPPATGGKKSLGAVVWELMCKVDGVQDVDPETGELGDLNVEKTIGVVTARLQELVSKQPGVVALSEDGSFSLKAQNAAQLRALHGLYQALEMEAAAGEKQAGDPF